jgi:hypothetical protein
VKRQKKTLGPEKKSGKAFGKKATVKELFMNTFEFKSDFYLTELSKKIELN